MAHRYIGRNRNAGYGYRLDQRLRRQAAFYVAHVWGWPRLGYWLDFDRNRYLEEYGSEGWPFDPDFDPDGWRELDPYGRD